MLGFEIRAREVEGGAAVFVGDGGGNDFGEFGDALSAAIVDVARVGLESDDAGGGEPATQLARVTPFVAAALDAVERFNGVEQRWQENVNRGWRGSVIGYGRGRTESGRAESL